MRLTTLILGAATYTPDKKVNLVVAATFAENVDLQNLYLELKELDNQSEDNTRVMNGLAKDAVDAYQEKRTSTISQRHIHFTLTNLDPGKHYTYELKTHSKESINVAAAIGEKEDHTHKSVRFFSPPLPGQIENYKIIVGGDQEAIDLLAHTKIDDEIADSLGYKFDQRELTTKIYQEIQAKEPHLFFHLSDLFNGEKCFTTKKVDYLKDFRTQIAEDFHATVRDKLAGIVSSRLMDDHDDGRNGANEKDAINHPHSYENARNAFNEFFPVPPVNIDGCDGLFYTTHYGDIQTWQLNGRHFHVDGETVLGETQNNWFKTSIESSEASVKLVMAPLPLIGGGKNEEEDFRSCPPKQKEMVETLGQNEVTAYFCADTHAYSRITARGEQNGEKYEVPQILVGTLGAEPQQITRKERKSFPTPLLPKENQEVFKSSTVDAYYTATKVPEKSLAHRGSRKYRAFKDGQWIGREVDHAQYGFVEAIVDMKAKTMQTMFYAFRQKSGKRPFIDEGTYPLKISSKQSVEAPKRKKRKLNAVYC